MARVDPVTIAFAATAPAWSWDGLDVDALDGIAVVAARPEPGVEASSPHPNLVDRLDHLVVATPDVDRTIDALAAAGLELRRTRDVDLGGTASRQAFFWVGETILELVGPVRPSGGGHASVWGLSFESPDLAATVAWLGPERCGPARDAVQPGRRIASLRNQALGLGLAVAVMSPHRRGMERDSPSSAT